MEKTPLNRYELYRDTALELYESPVLFRNNEVIIEAFRESAQLIKGMEDLFNNPEREKGQLIFEEIFQANILELKNESFAETVRTKCEKRRLDRKEKTSFNDSFEGWFNYLISIITSHLNFLIEKNFIYFFENPAYIGNNFSNYSSMPKTFLSYAFDDKGLSLALFFYFYKHGGFLYVDWMWHGKIKRSDILKKIIHDEVISSKQFLFLRTSASELNIKGAYTVRQWCSWEIGNFYGVDKDNKFLLAFYNPHTTNQLLETFRIMVGIKNGIIVSV